RSDKQVRMLIVATEGQQTPSSLALSAILTSTAFWDGDMPCSGQQADIMMVLMRYPLALQHALDPMPHTRYPKRQTSVLSCIGRPGQSLHGMRGMQARNTGHKLSSPCPCHAWLGCCVPELCYRRRRCRRRVYVGSKAHRGRLSASSCHA